MVILLINNGDRDDKFYREIFADFTQDDGIISVGNIPDAKKFLWKHLVELGGHVDLIVTNYNFLSDKESAYDLKIWLNGINDATYFGKLLWLKRIPIVLMHTDSSSSETDSLLGFDSVVRLSDIGQNLKRLYYVVTRTVWSWVDDLMGDYELIGADPRAPFLSAPLYWNFGCKVLSREYVNFPIRLPFLTFQSDIDKAEKAIEEFYKQIEEISRSAKSRQERKYHQTLMMHPEFLTGDVYDKGRLMHERNLMMPVGARKAFEQPDFLMVHKFHKFNRITNLVEVKLPQEKFIVTKNDALSSVLNKSYTQVADYEDYFKDSRNTKEILRVFGFNPIVKHSLLFGRSKERDIHMEILDKRIRRFGLTDIELITYDDLIAKREKLLNCQKIYYIP